MLPNAARTKAFTISELLSEDPPRLGLNWEILTKNLVTFKR